MPKETRENKKKRIDRKHRFTLRIDETPHCQMDALAFSHNISLNIVYEEAIKFAITSDDFQKKLQDKHPRDTRRGHYIYVSDTETKRIGKELK